MKIALLLLAPLLFASCRTYTPLNPNTMRPAKVMLPQNMRAGVDYSADCPHVPRLATCRKNCPGY